MMTEQDRQRLAKGVTDTLDDLFGPSYNRQFRPGVGESPTVVEVNDNQEKFTFDCYFRQQWVDKRLQFNNTYLDELPMD